MATSTHATAPDRADAERPPRRRSALVGGIAGYFVDQFDIYLPLIALAPVMVVSCWTYTGWPVGQCAHRRGSSVRSLPRPFSSPPAASWSPSAPGPETRDIDMREH